MNGQWPGEYQGYERKNSDDNGGFSCVATGLVCQQSANQGLCPVNDALSLSLRGTNDVSKRLHRQTEGEVPADPDRYGNETRNGSAALGSQGAKPFPVMSYNA